MKTAEVERALTRIDAIKRDDESAHSLEDALHVKVLRAIADGSPNAKELALAALKTLDIEFCRWCA